MTKMEKGESAAERLRHPNPEHHTGGVTLNEK